MSKLATLPPLPMTAATDFEEMTATVLLMGEWLQTAAATVQTAATPSERKTAPNRGSAETD